jgi:hypothetical protein
VEVYGSGHALLLVELVRLQYSGNAHGLIEGIGVVTGQYWIVDDRIFDPEGDGKTKLNHVREMLVGSHRRQGPGVLARAVRQLVHHQGVDAVRGVFGQALLKDHKVKLFRVEVSTNRTNWVVSDDLEQDSTQGAQNACAPRWRIEHFYRELEQLTGVEKCQCRKARIQRNHIARVVLVWIRLTAVARKASNVYKLKHDMLSGYLRQEPRSSPLGIASA